MLNGIYIEEIFHFDGKWYGILLSKNDPNFKHYVHITKIHSEGYDWMTVNETLEKALKYFHEKK